MCKGFMEFDGLDECLKNFGDRFGCKIKYDESRFEKEQVMMDYIKNRFMYELGKNNVHIFNDDDKFERSSCNPNNINIGYSRFINKTDYVWEYAFNVIYPESSKEKEERVYN